MATRLLKYFILLAFTLLIVAISSFWFNKPFFSEKDIVLEIEGPTQVSAGDEVIYKLKYENNTRSVLENLNFTFTYPEGSTVVAYDEGEAGDNFYDFKLDTLSSGEKGEKEFKVFLLGERGNIKVAKAVLSFKAGNLKSTFEKITTLSTTIVDTPISLTLVAPPSVTSGQAITYILDYRNQTDDDIEDLILEFKYPDGFKPQSFDPFPNEKNNIWERKELKEGEGFRISVSGTVEGQEGENKVVLVKLKKKISGEFVDYLGSSAVTVISNPIFGLDISVNNSGDYTASLGDRLKYNLDFSNDSNLNIRSVAMEVRLEGDMYDFSTLDTKGGFFNDETKTIRWDSTVMPELTVFSPNQKGKIDFSVSLKPFFSSVISGASRDRFVKASARFFAANTPEGVSGETSVSSNVITKISTRPAVIQAVYYNDQNFGFSGPLPMQVGEETFFTVIWRINNPGNSVDDAKITAALAEGVEWADEAKAEEGQSVPFFNPNTGEVVWNINSIPYGAGVSGQKYESAFRVKITPTSSQIGGAPNLVGAPKLGGVDSFTKQEIIIYGTGIGANNLADRPGEGRVQ